MAKGKSYAVQNAERCEKNAAEARAKAKKHPWAKNFWERSARSWGEHAALWRDFEASRGANILTINPPEAIDAKDQTE